MTLPILPIRPEDYGDPNWCPDCGEPRGVCRCDEEYREWEDEQDWENMCNCGRPANDYCGFCGEALCHMHFELGAGFCNQEHTQEQIDEYAKSIGATDTEDELPW